MGVSLPEAAYRVSLHVTGALATVLLLRLLLRQAFGSRIAYGVWLLVPISVASALAPKALAPIAMPVAIPALHLPWSSPLAGQAPVAGTGWGIVWCWIAGAVACALVQWRQQRAFVRRLGTMRCTSAGPWMAETSDIGPAVVGVFPPKIVLPADFHRRYTAQEQALVLAHERAHITRRDPVANLTAAVLRSLLWFHPLVHLAVRYFRTDQELACDAAVLEAHSRDRYHYAHAMLKGQIGGPALPAGCRLDSRAAVSLRQRILLLQTASPSRARRVLGSGVTAGVLIAGFAFPLRAPALTRLPLANLVGTWAMLHENVDASLTMRADSTFTVQVMGQDYMSGRAVRFAGDTATVQTVDPSTNRLETQPFVISLNDQNLTVRDRDDNVFVFRRTALGR